MKLVGFIKEYDNIAGASLFTNIKNVRIYSPFDNNINTSLLNEYFKHCPIIFGWMNYFKDLETGEVIEPQSYHTDGEWIWPSYMIYYLNKFNNWQLYQDFIKSIQNKNYHISVTKNNEYEAENILLSHFKK